MIERYIVWRTLFLGALLLTGCAVLTAQTPKLINVETDTSKFPELIAQFDLVDANGERIEALASKNIHIIENGQEISGQLKPWPSKQGLACILIVDTSGSMSELLPEIKDALADFIDYLGERDRTSLIVFNDTVKTVVPFTADKEKLLQELRSLRISGRTTELYYAVYKGLEAMQSPGLPDRKVVLVISDGKDEGTAYTLDDCIGAANESRVDVLGLGIAAKQPTFLLNLQRLAEMTGGIYLRVDKGQSWKEKIGLIRRQLAARWIFDWRSTLPGDGRSHQVQVRVNMGGYTFNKELLLQIPQWEDPAEVNLHRWILFGSIAIGVLLLGGLIYWLIRRGRKNRRELETKLDGIQQAQSDAQIILAENLAQQTSRIEDLAKMQSTQEHRTAPVPPAQRTKRKTEYMSSAAIGGGTPIAYSSAYLFIQEGPLSGSTLPLPGGLITLGREDDNRIVLDHPKVSLHHASIRNENGIYWLEDVGSTNGTHINGQRLSAPVALADGMEIRLGSLVDGSVMIFRGDR